MSPRILRRLQSRPKQQPLRKVDSKELVERFSTDFNHQHDSPLFHTIPPELRNKIFRYACQSAPLKDEAYPHDAYYFRPGYEYPQRIYTDLLRTCRLVYLETRLLPVKVNEHVFWCHRAPPGHYKACPDLYFSIQSHFTEEQLDAIESVHIFAQLWWLEQDQFSSLCRTDIRTQILHITIRHSDFWFWEDNRPLSLREEWLASLKEIRGLNTFVLELETMERDKDQVYSIAERLRKRRIVVHDGRTLTTEGTTVVKNQWIGPSAFEGGMTFAREENKWKQQRPKMIGPDPGLTYCTVTVTWN